MFEKVFQLALTMDYVRHWGMPEAVREIIQNALDSESPFEWHINDDTLTITSRFAKLEPKSLLLGMTSKADNKDSIGSFGEGYKIALLVLKRLNYDVTVFNNEFIWKPEFRHNKLFDADTLCIVSSTNPEKRQGVSFEIKGITKEDIDTIKESCLYMQKSIGKVKETSKGLILLEKPNSLFVGGLFICKTNLEFGYDIKPEHIRLERDRQTVSNFDLKWMTKEMWFETPDKEYVAKLMERGCTDLDLGHHGSSEMVKDACYRHFVKEHGEDAVIASSQAELDELVKKGMTKVVYSGSSSYRGNVESSRSYAPSNERKLDVLSINHCLKTWLEENKKHMRRSAIVNFQQLITKSTVWDNK